MTKLYLAGKMTGVPQFNFPAFHKAAAILRAADYDIVSPAEMDSDAVKAVAAVSTDGALDATGKVAGETWGQILARDVQVIADTVDGIVFLPDWWESRGARLEAFVALLTSKKQFGLYCEHLTPPIAWMSVDLVRSILRGNMP